MGDKIIAYTVGSFWYCPKDGKDLEGSEPVTEDNLMSIYSYHCDVCNKPIGVTNAELPYTGEFTLNQDGSVTLVFGGVACQFDSLTILAEEIKNTFDEIKEEGALN
jgi:hypothetical protein